MSSPALPLSDLIQVVVQVAAQGVASPQFNQGLIVGDGTSVVIPSVGANSRLRQYNGLAAMLTDGFGLTSPEYLAASLYFGQSPAPQFLWIGRRDLTALKTAIVHAGSGGTGYAAGDRAIVTQGGAQLGAVIIDTVAAGVVTGLHVDTANGGTGYAVANSLATVASTGVGVGLLVDVTAIGETPLVAVSNCRLASSVWWGVMACGTVAADHVAIAGFVAAMQPVGCYFYTTGDTAVLNNTVGNVAALLKAASYTRAFGVYSTTQAGLAPNNIYASAAALGSAMGLNSGLAASNFTLMFKLQVGVVLEPLTEAQKGVLTGLNINFYVGYNNAYVILQNGTTPVTNTYLDQVLNRDILGAAIQYNIMNLLVGTPSVPRTDPGQTQLIHAVNQACIDKGITTGYLAAGIWQGPQLISLNPGDPVPGFLAQSASFRTQSQADRLARKAMPIYLAVIEAGAIQSVVIGVYIQP